MSILEITAADSSTQDQMKSHAGNWAIFSGATNLHRMMKKGGAKDK
jgi:hypothetical protein